MQLPLLGRLEGVEGLVAAHGVGNDVLHVDLRRLQGGQHGGGPHLAPERAEPLPPQHLRHLVHAIAVVGDGHARFGVDGAEVLDLHGHVGMGGSGGGRRHDLFGGEGTGVVDDQMNGQEVLGLLAAGFRDVQVDEPGALSKLQDLRQCCEVIRFGWLFGRKGAMGRMLFQPGL